MIGLETFFATCYIETMNDTEFRIWRASLGWSQKRAAEELGVSRFTIRRYELGEISNERMLELACAQLAAIQADRIKAA